MNPNNPKHNERDISYKLDVRKKLSRQYLSILITGKNTHILPEVELGPQQPSHKL